MEGLSVIIPSFNTKDMTIRCIRAVDTVLNGQQILHELLIVDNNSEDGSREALQSLASNRIKIIQNDENVGYGKANNQALKIARYGHVLFLNSDVIVGPDVDFKTLLKEFEDDRRLGALTVRVNLRDGRLDKASHRGFPTVWRSLCYFMGLERLFGGIPVANRMFGGYHLTFKNLSTYHEIDSPTGAFYLAPLPLLQKLHGFDEDFFMYGEDLDLSYRIKQAGYKIVFDPSSSVVHYKYQSGLKNENDSYLRNKIRHYFYDAMKIFYRKHYAARYPGIFNSAVYAVINLKMR